MNILVVGYIAIEETLILYDENIEKCRNYFSKNFELSINDLRKLKQYKFEIEPFLSSQDYIINCYDGVHRALWKLKEDLATGFEIDELKLPILQESIEVLDFFDKDYFDAKSSNTIIIVSDNALDIYFKLKEKNIPVSIVGKTIKGHAGNLIIGNRLRHMSRPKKLR